MLLHTNASLVIDMPYPRSERGEHTSLWALHLEQQGTARNMQKLATKTRSSFLEWLSGLPSTQLMIPEFLRYCDAPEPVLTPNHSHALYQARVSSSINSTI